MNEQAKPNRTVTDAERWKWVRDHWDEIGGAHFPAGNAHPAWARPNDPAKLTAYVDEQIKAASGAQEIDHG